MNVKGSKNNLLFTPKNRGERIFESLNFKISREGMPPDPPTKDVAEARLNGPSAHSTRLFTEDFRL